MLSVDEKSQIQALDRTQPGLPIKKGRCGTMTHDYKRNGTATLFAALNTLDGRVISMCDDQHRHQEWLRFLRIIDKLTPKDKQVHLIVELRHPQTSGREALAGASPTLPGALHANQLLVAEHG